MDVLKTIALGVVGPAIAYGGAAELFGWLRSQHAPTPSAPRGRTHRHGWVSTSP